MELRTTERNFSRGVLVPVKTSRESRAGVLAAQLLCVSPEAAISSGQAVSRATGPAQGHRLPLPSAVGRDALPAAPWRVGKHALADAPPSPSPPRWPRASP